MCPPIFFWIAHFDVVESTMGISIWKSLKMKKTQCKMWVFNDKVVALLASLSLSLLVVMRHPPPLRGHLDHSFRDLFKVPNDMHKMDQRSSKNERYECRQTGTVHYWSIRVKYFPYHAKPQSCSGCTHDHLSVCCAVEKSISKRSIPSIFPNKKASSVLLCKTNNTFCK